MQISCSADGVAFGDPVAAGTWADTAAVKVVDFDAIECQAVRLTATSEAGGRGTFASCGSLNLIGKAGDTPVPGPEPAPAGNGKGKWTGLIDMPIVPVAAALLPNGNVRCPTASGSFAL